MSEISYVYISQDAAKTISVFRLESAKATLQPVQDMFVDGKAMPMAINRKRKSGKQLRLYVALRNEPYSFGNLEIDSQTGRLTLLGKTLALESAVYTSIDQSGRYLLCACNLANPARRSGLLTINPIDEDGIILSAGNKIRTPPKMHSVIVDPHNQYLFAASCDGDLILRYRFDQTDGSISADGLAPVIVMPKSGPRHMRFHPTGQFFYIVNEYDASIVSYRYLAHSGALLELGTYQAAPSEFKGENARAAELQITRNGRFLYASVRETNTIAAMRIDHQTGQLTLIGHYPTAKEPRGFAIDPSGQFIVAAGALSQTVILFRINQTNGALEKCTEYPIGEGANWVEIIDL